MATTKERASETYRVTAATAEELIASLFLEFGFDFAERDTGGATRAFVTITSTVTIVVFPDTKLSFTCATEG